MFSGTPCVSTTVAGIPEMITSGRDGLLVPPRDAPALSAAIERLLTDGEFARAIGAAGQETARTRFSVENTVAELWRLLREKCRVPKPDARRSWLPW